MVTRPVAGNAAATLDSINALCDAADTAAAQIAALQQGAAGLQAALAAEPPLRAAAIADEARARAAADAREVEA
ncbi:hypothetical protein, partial [Methylobacterium sp. D54C]